MEEDVFEIFRYTIQGKRIWILARNGIPVQVEIGYQDLWGNFKFDSKRGILSVTPTDTPPFMDAWVKNETKWWQFWKPDIVLMNPFTIQL